VRNYRAWLKLSRKNRLRPVTIALHCGGLKKLRRLLGPVGLSITRKGNVLRGGVIPRASSLSTPFWVMVDAETSRPRGDENCRHRRKERDPREKDGLQTYFGGAQEPDNFCLEWGLGLGLTPERSWATSGHPWDKEIWTPSPQKNCLGSPGGDSAGSSGSFAT